jgi:hypothetical protein
MRALTLQPRPMQRWANTRRTFNAFECLAFVKVCKSVSRRRRCSHSFQDERRNYRADLLFLSVCEG